MHGKGVIRRALPGLVLSVALPLTIVAGEPTASVCPPGGTLLVAFDVSSRAAILDAVPRMGTTPELTRGGIVQDGVEQLPTQGTYHVELYRCLAIGAFRPLLPRPVAHPAPVEFGVMHVTAPTAFDLWFAGVDFSGLRVPAT